MNVLISTPGGTRTRSFRVEGPASSPFRPRGHERKTEAAALTRPCLHERKERESNPQGPEAHPFSRRDTAPVAVLPKVSGRAAEPRDLLSRHRKRSLSGSGRRRTCNPPLKRRQLCQLSYGAVM